MTFRAKNNFLLKHLSFTNLWSLITNMWLELGFSEYLMVFEANEVKIHKKDKKSGIRQSYSIRVNRTGHITLIFRFRTKN